MPSLNLQLICSSRFMHTDNSPAGSIASSQPLPARLYQPSTTSEPPPSFFDWHSESDSASPSSSYSQSSELDQPESPSPPFTWPVAAAEACDGVHYILERFPAEGMVCMSPLFKREPITVDAGQRVRILEELNDYAMRVRVVATGETGLVPSWNVEGALERLARLNMQFNEAVTCPAESDTSETKSGLRARLAHVHARCIPFSARGLAHSDDESDDEADDSEDVQMHSDPETSPSASSNPAVYDSSSPLMGGGLTLAEAKKSVVFAECDRKVIFRYPSETLFQRRRGSRTDAVGSEGDLWCNGWEEPEGTESETDDSMSEDDADDVVLEEEMESRARSLVLAGTVEEITLINIYDNYE